MLIVFGGLPGAGKTTLARRIARELRATYLRVDAIEQALHASGALAGGVGPAGYVVAYALAEANLAQGGTVVADSVNPVAASRDAWRRVAAEAGVRLAEVEIVCSDAAEHRLRLEARESDVPGLVGPSWAEVRRCVYEPWVGPRIVLDTAGCGVEESLARLRARLGEPPDG